MKNLVFFILFQFLFSNICLSKNIDIKEELELDLNCKFIKLILKNNDYNFHTFLPEEVKINNLDLLKIKSIKPETLQIEGLSDFLSKNKNMEIKLANKEIIYFRALDSEKNYSESGILTRKSGELIHEITKNINTENSEKDISIYICKNKSENA